MVGADGYFCSQVMLAQRFRFLGMMAVQARQALGVLSAGPRVGAPLAQGLSCVNHTSRSEAFALDKSVALEAPIQNEKMAFLSE